MPDRCVVGGCENENSRENGISLHRIPFYADNRAEAIRRRKKWTDFVLLRRKNWSATRGSMICSDHFKAEDFARQSICIPGQTVPNSQRLIRDDMGIVAIPTIYKDKQQQIPKSAEKRSRRMMVREVLRSLDNKLQDRQDQDVGSLFEEQHSEDENEENDELDESESEEIHESDKLEDLCKSTQTPVLECEKCVSLLKKNRQLRNQWISSKNKLKKCRAQLRRAENNPGEAHKVTDPNPLPVSVPPYAEDHGDNDCDMDSVLESNYSDCDITEEEPMTEEETEAETTETETDTEAENDHTTYQRSKVSIKDDNLRHEPKHIVFLSQLLLLFQFCHFCKSRNPLIDTREVGTMVEVRTTCSNAKCRGEYTWKSQPNFPGTRIAAGNLLLCFAILLAGGSASKVFQIFRNMGLSCITLQSFFRHQRNILFPSIFIHWKKYQATLLNKIKALGENVVLAGDGRHDSMGHSAKYCAYTIFCCTLPLILHFTIVQRNEAGSSPAMEYMAFDKSLTYILGCGIAVATFVSDRHTSIAKHTREKLGHINHYFDLWHIKKKIHKVLIKISKESKCEDLVDWIKPCTNHYYWSVTSTITGSGKVIWAKFKSYLSHILNKHDNLDEPLFNKCAHSRDIQQRKWLKKDSIVYEKVEKALTNPRLVAAIEKSSPVDQTSCLEGFHSVINHFAPKMIGYSYVGMLCRHIIAALHFNNNLHREFRTRPDGSEQITVVYPKFKNGEATVRNLKVQPSFEYVEDAYQTMVSHINSDILIHTIQELKDMTPSPMNSMLPKEAKEVAIEKHRRRKTLTVEDVPPTMPETPVVTTPSQSTRRTPCCALCKKPMKGHKSVLDCPKNRPTNHDTTM